MKKKEGKAAPLLKKDLQQMVADKSSALAQLERELVIEAALERVRARTMEMQKSEELKEVIKILYQQLRDLKINLDHAGFVVDYTRGGDWNFWIADEQDIPSKITHPYFESVWATQFNEAKEHGAHFFATYLNFEEKNKFYDDLLSYIPGIAQASKDFYLGCAALSASTVLFDDVSLYIENFSGTAYSDEENKILMRFGKVFQQTYTRFLDLQKAEAQAREAQIEAALERTRAQSMMMQHSTELDDTLRVFHEQVLRLGIHSAFSFLWLPDEEKDRHIFWAAWAEIPLSDSKSDPGVFRSKAIDYPLDRNEPATAQCLIDWKSKEAVISYHVPPEGVESYFAAWSELFAGADQLRPKYYNKGLHYVEAFMKYGCFGVMVENPLAEEEKKILGRVATEFERTYTRFLDLQKAEAQAREAKIEAALEKVRSRSLAMHKSEELKEVVQSVFDRLNELNIEFYTAIIVIFKEDAKDVVWWLVNRLHQQHSRILIPYAELPYLHNLFEAKENGSDLFSMTYTGEEKKDFYNHLLENTDLKNIPGEQKKFLLESEFATVSLALAKKTGIHITRYSEKLFTKEENEILKRFSRVFDQAYVRFLDLHKAEGQAREAQIQLALERVRARTMAMHNSSELADTTGVLFQQFMNLGITPKRCLIGIMDKKNQSCEFFYTGFDGKVIPSPDLVPMNEQENLKQLYNAWLKNKDHLYFKLVGQQRVNWTTYIMNKAKMHFPEYEPDKINLKQISSVPAVFNTFFFTQGFIMLHTVEEIPEPEISMLKRFSGVFEQTYTRFLDLQKAEVQAREAQIQLALERVRARTMAMQQSDELPETSHILFEQMKELGEPVEQLTIGIVQEENNVIEISATLHGDTLKKIYLHSIDEPYMMTKVYKAWKTDQKTLIVELKGDELNSYNKYRNELTNSEMFPTNLGAEHRRIVYAAFFSKGMLALGANEPRPPQSLQLLERFASVFDLTYTRFLDLQKAEAQARESQIQLALERVRARTMAMQKSDELKDAAALLFQQLKSLGVPAYSCGYNIWEEDEKEFTSWMSTQDGSDFNAVRNIPLTEDANFVRYVESKQKGEQFFVLELRGQRMQEHYEYLKTIPAFKAWFDYSASMGFELPKTQIHNIANFSQGNLLFITLDTCPEFHDVFRRFASVFEQTYTRFLDLQKAEAQARESQIQLALERVRARTMAMHKSEELGEAAVLLYKELKSLGVTKFLNCGYVEINEENNVQYGWMTKTDGAQIEGYTIPLIGDEVLQLRYDAWKRKDPIFHQEVGGDKLKKHTEFTSPHLGSKEVDEMVRMQFPDPTIYYCGNFSHGYLHVITGTLLNAGDESLLARFTRVFEMTYKRFLDLQKAEAQAREAKIEAALEKVRSRSLAMHKSDELQEVVNALFERLMDLDIEADSSNIAIFKEGTRDYDYWIASNFQKRAASFHMPYIDLSLTRDVVAARESGEDFGCKAYSFEEKNEWFNYAFKNTDFKYLSEERKQYILGAKAISVAIAFSKNIGIQINRYSGNLAAQGEIDILKRFAKVFEQAYTRFLDLQKAEAQAREAQIEAALERVRSRTIGMQKSEELRDVIQVIHEQLIHLQFEIDNMGFLLDYRQTDDYNIWAADANGVLPTQLHIPYFDHPFNRDYIEQRDSGVELLAKIYSFEEKNSWLEKMFDSITGLPKETKDALFKIRLESHGLALSRVFMKNIGLYLLNFSGIPYPEEQKAILIRFARVFEQTYTRFLDLQKAETQAREAQIEAALERVRASAMAMHSSEGLLEVTNVLREQIALLGEKELESIIIHFYDEENDEFEAWYSYRHPEDEKGEIKNGRQILDWTKTARAREDKKNYHGKESDYTIVADRAMLKEWYEHLYEVVPVVVELDDKGDILVPDVLYYNYSKISGGALLLITNSEASQHSKDLLKRAAKVFNLAYSRFLDLQKAEAQAREAVKHASVDRIRAEIASMRTTSDLQRITPLIWSELTTLDIPFIRCGVFIMDESQQQVHTFLSTPDGKAIAAFHMPYDTPGNLRKAIHNWQLKEKYIDHWDEEEFTKFAQILADQGALQSAEQYLKTIPQGGFYLHFLPFLQGMLYVGNTTQLDEEEIELIQSVADAFSTAYARYEDFNKLEAAKLQVDSALSELQVTQKQLIQSEKMASLGELTAGIAHEIQNPLNFVNNFSEVNRELIAELKEEIEKGNLSEIKIIATDIETNEEKINHHGKRADAIVKNMLQHSRSSTSQREPTNINALADEYLRLSYHGMRAKDKSFNATLQTDFNETIEKINIIPQDIGRVLLNLYNNAFYAVNEKIKVTDESYRPTIVVSTKKISDKIELTVKDNGNGIPQKVVDKIFQPFFTTKPTGSGTGLGLSLSYDIIKAHSGEIKVETEEGEGTEFVIVLPAGY